MSSNVKLGEDGRPVLTVEPDGAGSLIEDVLMANGVVPRAKLLLDLETFVELEAERRAAQIVFEAFMALPETVPAEALRRAYGLHRGESLRAAGRRLGISQGAL